MGELVFGADEAGQYEAWFETVGGRRADRLEKALFARLLEPFGRPGSLLEIGCGTGHFGRWFGERGWQVAGVDISLPMLAEARRRNPASRVAIAQGEALPFGDGEWDVAAMITVLEFVPDPAAVLREALRVSRRGLLIGVLNSWSPLALRRRIEAWIRPSPYGAASFISPGRLRSLVEQGHSGPSLAIRSATTLWPAFVPIEESTLPFGAFLGMAVLAKE